MKSNLKAKEYVWYLIGSTIAIFGIVLMVFGIVGHHLPGSSDNNFIKVAEQGFMDAIHVQIDFRMWGLILFAFGLLVDVIALLASAKKADRDYEKKIRRQQRQEALKNSTIEVKNAVEIIEEPAPKEVPAE